MDDFLFISWDLLTFLSLCVGWEGRWVLAGHVHACLSITQQDTWGLHLDPRIERLPHSCWSMWAHAPGLIISGASWEWLLTKEHASICSHTASFTWSTSSTQRAVELHCKCVRGEVWQGMREKSQKTEASVGCLGLSGSPSAEERGFENYAGHASSMRQWLQGLCILEHPV